MCSTLVEYFNYCSDCCTLGNVVCYPLYRDQLLIERKKKHSNLQKKLRRLLHRRKMHTITKIVKFVKGRPCKRKCRRFGPDIVWNRNPLYINSCVEIAWMNRSKRLKDDKLRKSYLPVEVWYKDFVWLSLQYMI